MSVIHYECHTSWVSYIMSVIHHTHASVNVCARARESHRTRESHGVVQCVVVYWCIALQQTAIDCNRLWRLRQKRLRVRTHIHTHTHAHTHTHTYTHTHTHTHAHTHTHTFEHSASHTATHLYYRIFITSVNERWSDTHTHSGRGWGGNLSSR